MKTTFIAVSIATAIALSSVAADARKSQILKDSKGTIGWSFNKKTKRWKAIRARTPQSERRKHRKQILKEYREYRKKRIY